MRSSRRLPPLLRALGLLCPLALLAGCGISTWAWRLGQESGKSPLQLYLTAQALVALNFAFIWPVGIYNRRWEVFRRPRRGVAWLDSWLDVWWGQLLSVLGFAVIPIASIVLALLISPASPLFWADWAFLLLFWVVWVALLGWVVL